MKIVRFKHGTDVKYGVVESGNVQEINGDIFAEIHKGKNVYGLADVRLLSPVEPSKVVCVGKNYREHAFEMGEEVPEEPVIFLKPPTAVIGPEEGILCPEMSSRVDYEGELAVVIRNKCRNVPPQDVRRHILGYTCGNDVTARDLQKKDGQWTRAKSFDTFCPLGPWIETELDPEDLKIQTFLNGELRQSSTTKMMITPVYELVSFISRIMTLLPGDVIMTGTPEGIGPMRRGDVVEVEIEGIGKLKNRVF
ncbi:fumarylacetoacetate hydrolase family protein [Thermoanaerobacterium sp. DL9XJH110]|uniref:fumarylacetoacetate hydrolase family protein n=1 Tax=Thermoanaerobacterium sp. DL9XJH110 TaxID=3386643 RepID=UPI003BB7FE61